MSHEVSAAYDLEILSDPSDAEYTYFPVEVIAWFSEEVDPHYGADADGRRGVRVVVLLLDRLVVYSTAGLDVTDWLKEKHPKQYEEVRAFADTTLAEKVVV